MDVLRHDLSEAFEGPLSDVAGIPAGILYAVVLTVSHLAGKQAQSAVVDALRPLLGEPVARTKGWFATLLRYEGRIPATVKVRKDSLTLAVGQRLRSAKVEEIVQALAQVPGAHDLEVRAQRRVFAEPGAATGGPLE